VNIRPVAARWFEVLTARDELEQAVETLAKTGSVELETHSDTTRRASMPDLRDKFEEYGRLARRYQPYWPPQEDAPNRQPGNPAVKLDHALEQIYGWQEQAAPLVQQIDALHSEQTELELLTELLQHNTDATLDLALAGNAGPVMDSRGFVLPPATTLASLPASVLVSRTETDRHLFLLTVGPPDILDSLQRDLGLLKGRPIHIPSWLKGSAKQALHEIDSRKISIKDELDGLRAKIDDISKQFHLTEVLADISHLEWFLTHVDELPVSENFAWITGWTSDNKGSMLEESLHKAGVKAVVHYPRSPVHMSPPMVMHNPIWAQPFELFVKLLGTPDRNEADPSRFLAVIVPLLFGYMFGDVGHGLVLFITGLFLERRWPIIKLLSICGAASIVFGFLFGSIFGMEDIIEPLWLHPIENPLLVLFIPLIGGILILLLGLALAGFEEYWAGHLKDWLLVEAAVIVMYISILASIIFPQALMVSLAGLLWYFGGSLYRGRQRLLASIGHALGALVESLMQLLINTLSFFRVGAFALAHSGLSLAFIVLADATSSPYAAIPILIIGNIIIIILEGLVVSIQTTRLVLFEFFIRFLHGSGRIFKPLQAPDSGKTSSRSSK
jgi:V/A-type H+-transporting ATPase subunit I